MSRSGQVAIVKGAASGIGAATAREFAIEGASVAILDINVEGGEQTAATLRAEGHEVVFHSLDVSDTDACHTLVQAIAAKYGRLDYLVNSAVSFLTKGLDATTAN